MHPLSDRVKLLNESATLKMAKMSRELASKGVDVINFNLGEPDFDTPTHIKESAKKAIDDNYSHYTPVAGFPELRKAIAAKLKRDNGLNYLPEEIVVSTGAKQSIFNIICSVINPGDEVLVPVPYWVSYHDMIRLAGGVPVFLDTDKKNDFKVTASQVEKAMNARTRMFLFSSPCNPTGTVYSKDELESLAHVFAKNQNVVVVSDEIYELINFTGSHESIAQFEIIRDQTVIVNGLSKSFAMTGWRIGYIAGPKWISEACEKIQGQVTSGTSSISQRAAITALTDGNSSAAEMNKAFHQRRDLFVELLEDIEGLSFNVPAGAFYLFPDVSRYFGKSANGFTITSSADLAMYLLEQAHVSVVSGDAFGAAQCIRISFATSEEKIREGMKRMKNFLHQLK